METFVNPMYVNSVSVSHSAYEVRMEFFIESPDSTVENVERKKVADLRLSPQLLKDLQKIIESTILSYEKTVGKIPIKDSTTNE